MSVTEEFRAARDRLLELRTDYQGACRIQLARIYRIRSFGYDWFDQGSRIKRAQTPALIITERDKVSTRRTWAELSERSTQLARWLSDQGCGARRDNRGDAR